MQTMEKKRQTGLSKIALGSETGNEKNVGSLSVIL
jgi:hypothetical protein